LNAVAPLWTRPAALIMFIRLYGLTTAEGQMSAREGRPKYVVVEPLWFLQTKMRSGG